MLPLPEEFEKRMKAMLGEDEYEKFRSAFGRERARGLRLNPLKMPAVSPDLANLYLANFGLRPVPWAEPYGFFYDNETRPGKSPLHEAGLYYLQEPSAMAVAALAGAEPGDKVLDLCAAPGGKSTMLAGELLGRGLLVSNEINPGRAKILSQNVERMGIANAVVTNETPEKLAERFPAFFDRVIVDAPCSGEGMFRKEEQALLMWSPENVENCARRQEEILDQAAVMVKSGGFLVYSTCTFAPAEDEDSAENFQRRHPEFSLVDLPAKLGGAMEAFGFDTGHPEWYGKFRAENEGQASKRSGQKDILKTEEGAAHRDSGMVQGEADIGIEALRGTIRLWPHRLEGEGHFLAVFRKEGNLRKEAVPMGSGLAAGAWEKRANAAGKAGKRTGKRIDRMSQERGNRQESWSGADMLAAAGEFAGEALREGCLDRYAELSGSGAKRFGDDLYLMPYESEIPTDGLRVLRPGLQIGTMKKGRFEPSHALAMALHPEDAVRSLDLPSESREAAAYLRGETLPCDPSWKGWVLVAADGVSMGWGKASGGVLKNHYPKGLRK